MKRFFSVLLLSVVSFAQAPIKTAAEADQKIFQMRQQIDSIHQELLKEPKFQQWTQLQQQVDDMKVTSRVLHQNEQEAAALAAHNAATKKK